LLLENEWQLHNSPFNKWSQRRIESRALEQKPGFRINSLTAQ